MSKADLNWPHPINVESAICAFFPGESVSISILHRPPGKPRASMPHAWWTSVCCGDVISQVGTMWKKLGHLNGGKTAWGLAACATVCPTAQCGPGS